ncbi:MAG: hypothetical protein IJJ77_04440 [Paludibacteraceae bacterium]|nr:hypothetical protein [Paludibacteraceae bacterium]
MRYVFVIEEQAAAAIHHQTLNAKHSTFTHSTKRLQRSLRSITVVSAGPADSKQ